MDTLDERKAGTESLVKLTIAEFMKRGWILSTGGTSYDPHKDIFVMWSSFSDEWEVYHRNDDDFADGEPLFHTPDESRLVEWLQKEA